MVATSQSTEALAKANRVREEWSTVRNAIRLGALTVADALYEECCQRKRLWDLVITQRGFGSHNTARWFNDLELPSRLVKVEDLSGPERRRIVQYYKRRT